MLRVNSKIDYFESLIHKLEVYIRTNQRNELLQILFRTKY